MRTRTPKNRKSAVSIRLCLLMVLLSSLLLLQACGGKNPDPGSAASGTFSYTSFQSGDLNSETGSPSGGNTNPIRSADFISISDLVTAQINMEYGIRFFAYDDSHHFLGASDDERVIMASMVLEEYPACAYVKLLAESRDGSKLDPARPDAYGLIVLVRSEYKAREPVRKDISDISGDYDGRDIRSLIVSLEQTPGSNRPQLLSCSSHYRSESSSYPTIQLSLLDEAGAERYGSPLYRLGGSGGEAVENEWRIPPYQAENDVIRITIIIPADVVLSIDDMQMQEDSAPDTEDAILYTANQGFSSMCPPSTLPAFWMAGELGYPSCSVIPQFTSDGVCLCFQDVSTIRALLRYPDGSEIEAGSGDDRPLSQFTYEELMQLDAGIGTNQSYSGKKVPMLEQFFDICAQYHMAPVLSIPSDRDYRYDSGRRHFSEIRDLAEHFGVLDSLRIKTSDRDVMQAAADVFGHDIAGYIIAQPIDEDWDPLDFAKAIGFADRSADGMRESDYSAALELSSFTATNEKIRTALDEGFPVSIEAAGDGLSGPEMERLIDLGVTEFTLDRHCSIGLDW